MRPTAGGIKQHLNHLLAGMGSQYEIAICGPEELRDWAGQPLLSVRSLTV